MQSEFVFAPGGYAMDLEGELAKALQARTEMLARKRNPKLWRLTDQMQSFADILHGAGDGNAASIEDGRVNQHAVDAILASAESGKWFTL